MAHIESAPSTSINIPGLLKDYRKDARLTQKQLAWESGITQGTISNIETGVIFIPRVETVDRLLNTLKQHIPSPTVQPEFTPNIQPKYGNRSALQKALWDDPDHRAMRVGRMKAFWEDPDKKRERVARIHSPDATKKRKESQQRYLDEHPESRERRAIAPKAARDRRISKALGDNPKTELERLIWEENLNGRQIGLRLGVNSSTVHNWEQLLGVRRKDRSEAHPKIGRVKASNLEVVEQAQTAGLLDFLTAQQRVIIESRYGRIFNGLPALLHKQIAVEILGKNSSRQAINSSESKALRRLRKLLAERAELQE